MKNLWDRLSHSHQELITLQAKKYPNLSETAINALKSNVIWSDLRVGELCHILTTLDISIGDQSLYMLHYGDGIIRETE
jgi:hypothetical protein